jgi:hypothetical protein
MSNGKRGGQPGNRNAIKHGRFSVPLRAARRAASRAAWEAKERQSQAWMSAVPRTDYAAICDGLRALRISSRTNSGAGN